MNLKQQIANFCENNLTVIREEGDEFVALCPFHENTNTPAFSINKTTGLWHCFNANCAKKGRFQDLVKGVTGEVVFIDDGPTDNELINKLMEANVVKAEPEFDEAMERIAINYRNPQEVAQVQYLIDRGFAPGVLEHFEVGFSKLQDRIVIPVRDENYKVVGFIGRATNEEIKPKYRYTDHFPRRNLLLNLCNAKQYDTAIVVEGSLDHIMVHQAGFPNVISTMGSTISQPQLDLMNRYFSGLIIFSDNDEAGFKSRSAIMDGAARLDLSVVAIPEGLKDPGEMSEKQIQEAIHTRITHLEYLFNTL